MHLHLKSSLLKRAKMTTIIAVEQLCLFASSCSYVEGGAVGDKCSHIVGHHIVFRNVSIGKREMMI
jgi:uncharacterized protein YwlG (UPF0340 family)